jgi:hypothetical protein
MCIHLSNLSIVHLEGVTGSVAERQIQALASRMLNPRHC